MKHLIIYEKYGYKINVGDIVICIDNDDIDEMLTVGKKYKVDEMFKETDGTVFVKVTDVDTGFSVAQGFGFFPDRFVSELEYNVKKYNL